MIDLHDNLHELFISNIYNFFNHSIQFKKVRDINNNTILNYNDIYNLVAK